MSEAEHDGVKKWWGEIEDALKREQGYRKVAKEVVGIYESEDPQGTPYNILFANTELMSPALYSSTPRPVVKARQKRQGTLESAAAKLCEAYLTYFVDSGDPKQIPFDTLMDSAVQSALVPGRGITRFKYDAAISYADKEQTQPTKVESEYVCADSIDYDRILMGYAQTWARVPWIAFIDDVTKAEYKAMMKKDPPTEVKFLEATEDQEEKRREAGLQDAEGAKLARVYTIWDKDKRRVLYLADGLVDTWARPPLADPLKLEGFFPIYAPLQLFKRIKSMVPKPLYESYRQQAEELNEVTRRITRIVRAMKARGAYNARFGTEFEKILQQEDAVFIPVDTTAALGGDSGNMTNAIWVWPVEKLVGVLQELAVRQQTIKSTIYEIMGISDILRGSSVASETASAQTIKDKWGVLRLKNGQKLVMNYVRGNLRLAAELAFGKMSPDTIAELTGTNLPRQKDRDAARERVQQAEIAAQQAQMMAQAQPPQPGQEPPPPPPPPNPADVELAQMPSLEEVCAVLRDGVTTRYKVDIETNSTVDAEATEDKTDVTEYLGGLTQLILGLQPMIEKKSMSPEVAQGILLEVTKRFRFGRDLEDLIMQIKPPPEQQGPDPAEAQKMMDQYQKDAAKLEQDKQKLEMDKMKGQMEAERERMQIQMEKEKALLEVEKAKVQLQMQQMQVQLQGEKTKMAVQTTVQKGQLAMEQEQAQLEMAGQRADFESQRREQDAEFGTQQREARLDNKAMKMKIDAQRQKAQSQQPRKGK